MMQSSESSSSYIRHSRYQSAHVDFLCGPWLGGKVAQWEIFDNTMVIESLMNAKVLKKKEENCLFH